MTTELPSSSSTIRDGPDREDRSQGSLIDDRYVLVECVGEGGMGRVWRAYDVKLERSVALKLTRKHVGSRDADERMVREARAMAQLSHPNVLPVYDVVEAEGHVCIVMELVLGDTLHQWLEERPRGARELLASFAAAARGLHAAHEAGFVHRDFKPSNVLVGRDGRVRVTDFGLARLSEPTEPRALEVGGITFSPAPNTRTVSGLVLGTPAYMSPEHRAGQQVDARGDQYSFCVGLFEALVGERPPRPDAGGSSLEERLSRTRGPRRCPSSIRRLLRRGLALDPADRYASMAPIIATLEAQAKGRSRTLVVMGAAAVALGLAGVGWRVTLHVAEAAERRGCEQQGAAILEQWSPVLADGVEASLIATGVDFAADTNARVRPWLDDYAERWSSLRTEACVAARVEGGSEVEWERVATCLDERRQALDAVVRLLGEASPEVVRAAVTEVAGLPRLEPCTDPAWLARQFPLPEDPDARARVLALRQALLDVSTQTEAGLHEQIGPRVAALVSEADALDYAPVRAQARLVRASVEEERGDFARAAEELEAAYLIAGVAGDDQRAATASIRLVHMVGYRLADREQGLWWGRLARMQLDRMALPGNPDEAALANNIGLVRGAMGDFDDAIEALERGLDGYREAYGSDHPEVALAASNLGFTLTNAGRYEEAEARLLESLVLRRRQLGDHHPDVAWSLNNLGTLHGHQGRSEAQLAELRESLEIFEHALGPNNPDTAMAMANLAVAYQRHGEPDRALELAARATEIWAHTLGDEHPLALKGKSNLASMHYQRGDLELAAEELRGTIAAEERVLGPSHPDLASSLLHLGLIEVRLGHRELGLERLARAVAIRVERLGPDHPDVAEALAATANAHARIEEWPAAIEAYQRALHILERPGSAGELLPGVLLELGQAQRAAGDLAGANATLTRASSVAEEASSPAPYRGRVRFAQAKVAWDAAVDRPGALALAHEAAALLEDGGKPEEIELLAAWIAEHEG